MSGGAASAGKKNMEFEDRIKIDDVQLKRLIGAHLWEFDRSLKKKGENPDELRAHFEKHFCRNGKYQSLSQVTFLRQTNANAVRGVMAQTIDESANIRRQIESLVKGKIGETKMMIVKFNSTLDHWSSGCWCCGGSSQTDVFIVIYLTPEGKLSTFQIKVNLESDNMGIVDDYFDEPYVVDYEVPIKELICQYGCIVTELGETFGAKTVVASI